MQVEFISIGDELLIGQTVNTNASWLGNEFALRGANVRRVVTISDQEEAIFSAIDQGMSNADVVIITGGLGPTKDDITKKVICDYFQDKLIIDEATLLHVKSFFERANRVMLDVNVQQAAVPKSCLVLPNALGTAPGMWMEKKGKIVICLPGVPYEMKGLITNEVFPRLEERFGLNQFYSKTANIQGVGESYLADKMAIWEDSIHNNGLELAYLPSPGIVRLRITSKRGSEDKEKIDSYFLELEKAYPENFFGYGDKSLAEVVGELLKANKQTVGTAESCTGGAISASIVAISGSSAYFNGSLTTYSNTLKHQILGVNPIHFETVGAVSKEVVEEMAIGGKEKLNVDYCISVSGIAGPNGAVEGKPVGTVWIGLAGPKGVLSKQFLFNDNRERVIHRIVLAALNLLKNEIIQSNR